MANPLTETEEKLLNQHNKQRLKHNILQAEYRKRKKAKNPNYNVQHNEYMRNYNANRSKMIRNIKDKLIEQPTITEIENFLEWQNHQKEEEDEGKKIWK